MLLQEIQSIPCYSVNTLMYFFIALQGWHLHGEKQRDTIVLILFVTRASDPMSAQ
jgi:hypothetical protein